MPSPSLPYTRCRPLYMLTVSWFFSLLNSVFWKACSIRALMDDNPSLFYSSIVFYRGDVCGSPSPLETWIPDFRYYKQCMLNNHVHTSFHTGADSSRGEIPRSTAPPFLPGKLLLIFWHPRPREPDIRRGMSRELQEACLPSPQSWESQLRACTPPSSFASKFPWVNTSIDDV